MADLDGLLESAEVASTVSAVGCVPAEAALACIVKEPLLAQYRLSSSACMRLVCEDLQLPGVCEVLHDVLLCGNGHFLQVIIDTIRRQLSHFGELRVKRLNDAISEALTDSLMKYHGLSISHLGLKFRCSSMLTHHIPFALCFCVSHVFRYLFCWGPAFIGCAVSS